MWLTARIEAAAGEDDGNNYSELSAQSERRRECYDRTVRACRLVWAVSGDLFMSYCILQCKSALFYSVATAGRVALTTEG